MKVLVTGGTGYVGSHTVVELLKNSFDVMIVDNFVNSSNAVLSRIEEITNKKPLLIKADVTNLKQIQKIFKQRSFDAVIHFAALKAVGESVESPLKYYTNNVIGLINVLDCIEQFSVPKLIFSSSATVYGDPEEVPLKELSRVGVGITNPYGQTKYMCEQIITDCARANKNLQATLLRYFNPVGAHESGLIGEDPSETPNNLMPYITQVAVGTRSELKVFGGDYATSDGTDVRDYIHVVDLAKGHLAALNHTPNQHEVDIYNLGTGVGYSVLEIIKAFEDANSIIVPYEITKRRPGDIATCFSDASKAQKELNWKAEKTLTQMCEDAWRWQTKNPNGYSN